MKRALKLVGLILGVTVIFYAVSINVVAAYTRYKTHEIIALKDEHEQIFLSDLENKKFAKYINKGEPATHKPDSFSITIDRYKGFIDGGRS